jgi:hypothetical protein
LTLIVLNINKGIPIITGDILVTSGIVDGNESTIPLPFHLTRLENLTENRFVRPVDLKQKIYVINNSLVVALASSLYYMKLFLNDIESTFKYLEASVDQVAKFINDYGKSEKSHIEYLIVGIDPKSRSFFRFKSLGWQEYSNEYFGQSFAIGSGTSTYLKELEVAKFRREFTEIIDSQLQSIFKNVYLIGNFIALEKISLNSILERWGAGFELIYASGGKFHKLNDISYALNIIDVYEDLTYAVRPFLISNFRYYEDLLVISISNFKQQETYYATRLDSSLAEYTRHDKVNSQSFSYTNFMSVYILNYKGRLSLFNSVLVLNQTADGKKIHITISDADGTPDVYISEQLKQNLFTDFEQRVKTEFS